VVQDKFYVDEIYDRFIVRPLRAFSVGLYKVVDRLLIDGLLVGGVSWIVDRAGRIARSFQAGGDGQRYMAVFAIGVAVLVFFTTRPSADLKVRTDGLTVNVDARRGTHPSPQPLEYIFDFGDGSPEETGPSAEAHHVYDRAGTYTIKLTVKDPRWGTRSTAEKKDVEVK
jgi:hypothetical protein